MENTRQIPRIPTQKEAEELTRFLCTCYGTDEDEELGILERTYIAVFDNYITDGPGFLGKVFCLVYPGSPEFYEVVTKSESGEMKKREKDI